MEMARRTWSDTHPGMLTKTLQKNHRVWHMAALTFNIEVNLPSKFLEVMKRTSKAEVDARIVRMRFQH